MNEWNPSACFLALAIFAGVATGSPLRERLDSTHRDFLNDRRAALPVLSDPYGVPPAAREVIETPKEAMWAESMDWKRNVVATVFWVGELPGGNNPTSNTMSAWDPNWVQNFGGTDDPENRNGWNPVSFTPRMNPFYVALPYNDVIPGGLHCPSASRVIPWFWHSYRGDGISVCKGRWLAIHYRGKVCYAQWEDVGPFAIDDWPYVFGGQAPTNGENNGAGIDLSPAVRDYLSFTSGERVQWRFLDDRDVPDGPWRRWEW